MTWTNEDFAAVYSFLDTMREVLQSPESVPALAEILADDCQHASDALGRIVDAINA